MEVKKAEKVVSGGVFGLWWCFLGHSRGTGVDMMLCMAAGGGAWMPESRKSRKKSSLVVFSGTLEVKKAEKSRTWWCLGSGGALGHSRGTGVDRMLCLAAWGGAWLPESRKSRKSRLW